MSAEPNKPLPKAGDGSEREPVVVPIWLIGLLAISIYWGMLYVNDHAGEFSAKVYAPYPTLAEVEAAQPHTSGPGPEGKKNFVMICSTCHQNTGLGVPAEGKPPLAGSEWVLAPLPDRMIRIALYGLQGPITVKGQEFGTLQMPAWGGTGALTNDETLAAVLTYIRQNKEWGNNASAVTAEQVKAIRDSLVKRDGPGNYSTQFTVPELQKVPDSK